MEKKVQNTEQQKKILSLKHREIENLRFEDLNENLEILKSEKFRQNCKIGEKHIALAAMNNDKKQYLNVVNDKKRSQIVKERMLVKSEERPFAQARRQYLHPAAAVPDLVKWNPKEIKKLTQKKEE